MGTAQTGTGKTAAFVLPLLQRLINNPVRTPKGTPRALILAPTRELAAQISRSIHDYGRYLKLKHTVVYGGVNQYHQVRVLNFGTRAMVVLTLLFPTMQPRMRQDRMTGKKLFRPSPRRNTPTLTRLLTFLMGAVIRSSPEPEIMIMQHLLSHFPTLHIPSLSGLLSSASYTMTMGTTRMGQPLISGSAKLEVSNLTLTLTRPESRCLTNPDTLAAR